MRAFASRRLESFWAFVFVTILAGAKTAPHNAYPNELKGFELYAKYLAPLRPGVSGKEVVSGVLGDTAPVERNGWTIMPTYTTKRSTAHNPATDLLAELIVRPDGIVPMGAVKFSPLFHHCRRSVSEINISFDVYSDSFGLEYWLHEEDSRWGKKGDLYQIRYGSGDRHFNPNEIC